MTPYDRAIAAMHEAADRLTNGLIEAGAALYDRKRHLPRLIGHRALILSDAEIIEALELHIAAESRRISSGHWVADHNRMLALKQAYAAETKAAEKTLEGATA